jgi:TIR domain-containing protein
MARIFVSHASADKPLVDKFVDIVLLLGCRVPPADLFYSSRPDTGVPSGMDLNAYIRNEVAGPGLVVAVLSPTFQMRPFCIAELGAAWSRAGRLFPLALPTMARTDLDGVLSGVMVRSLDDGAALNELADRVAEVTGQRPSATHWGGYRDQWLSEVGTHVRALEAVTARPVISAAACSREPDHMEVFWTDGSGKVFYRWWLSSSGWSKVDDWDEPSATHVAAVSRADGDEWLFGVPQQGQMWARRWRHKDPPGFMVAGKPEWIPGEVRGPLTAVSHEPSHLELVAWTPAGEQCHVWRVNGEWTEWTPKWSRHR